MARWNFNNMSHMNLTLPSFQPENSPPGNDFNHPTDLINAPLSLLGPNQMKNNNSECSFGYGLPHSSSGHQSSSSLSLPWEIYSEVNRHSLSVVVERQREWLKMLNQRKLDQDFLNNFMQARIVHRSQSPLIKMSGLDALVKETEKPTSHKEVAEQSGEACENRKDEHNLEQIRKKLELVKNQIVGRLTSEETQEKIMKRKKKREWIKRKKDRKKKELEEAIQRRKQLNMLIDDQREIIRNNALLRKRHQEAKRDVDVVLNETRRKRSDVKRISQLLNSLRELRTLRARSLESRCALFSKQEDTDNFNITLDQLDLIVQNKVLDYEKEEKSLKLTMHEHHRTQSEETVKKLWSKYSLKGSLNNN